HSPGIWPARRSDIESSAPGWLSNRLFLFIVRRSSVGAIQRANESYAKESRPSRSQVFCRNANSGSGRSDCSSGFRKRCASALGCVLHFVADVHYDHCSADGEYMALCELEAS